MERDKHIDAAANHAGVALNNVWKLYVNATKDEPKQLENKKLAYDALTELHDVIEELLTWEIIRKRESK